MSPVRVEVVAYAPTGFYHCTHCEIVFQQQGVGDRIHAEQLQSAMPQDMLETYARLSAWITALVARHGDRVLVKVIDAASVEGVWKALRHGLRRFPAVILEGGETFDWNDVERAEAAVLQRVGVVA